MKKLLKFKDWVTVPEAARYLSILFGDNVTEADVLRLALDEHLALSVNFVNTASVQCSKIADDGPVATVSIQMSEDEAARSFEELRIASLGALEEFGNGLEFSSNVAIKYITGIWDVLMGGSTRAHVENKYQSLSGGPAIDPYFLEQGFVVTHPNGTRAIIVERFSDMRSRIRISAHCPTITQVDTMQTLCWSSEPPRFRTSTRCYPNPSQRRSGYSSVANGIRFW